MLMSSNNEWISRFIWLPVNKGQFEIGQLNITVLGIKWLFFALSLYNVLFTEILEYKAKTTHATMTIRLKIYP